MERQTGIFMDPFFESDSLSVLRGNPARTACSAACFSKQAFWSSRMGGFCLKHVHCESQFQRNMTNTDLSQAICKAGWLTQIQEIAEIQPEQKQGRAP